MVHLCPPPVGFVKPVPARIVIEFQLLPRPGFPELDELASVAHGSSVNHLHSQDFGVEPKRTLHVADSNSYVNEVQGYRPAIRSVGR